jgi:hypothetical protein
MTCGAEARSQCRQVRMGPHLDTRHGRSTAPLADIACAAPMSSSASSSDQEEHPMRAPRNASAILLLVAALALAACSGRESVKSNYIGTASMDQDQVTALLSQNGYQDITNLHKNGQDWVGSATKDGSPVNFDIGKDGNIRTR